MVSALLKFDFSVVRHNMAIKLNNNFLIIMGTSFLLLLAYHIKKE
ncbi:16S rRNA (guanine(966)-N(2))-methyltransferase [Streptococcus agalactiae ILRI005]|nr:16S rRNA (guanine(966)-N(2))-methyltransferase [Streptococcus agalactiae ILRI005]